MLGAYLGANLSNSLVISGALTVATSATATLNTALDAAAKATVTTSSVDVTALATQTAAAYQTYTAAVRGVGATLTSAFGAKGGTGAELVLVSEGSFQLN